MPLWVPEWVVTIVGRFMCRFLLTHNVTCRGPHSPVIGRWGWPYH